jgi:hypothetical protein
MATNNMQPIFYTNKQMAGSRTQSSRAQDFRLVKKQDGDIALVGAFEWSGYDKNGFACGGVEWQELPMIEMPHAGVTGA